MKKRYQIGEKACWTHKGKAYEGIVLSVHKSLGRDILTLQMGADRMAAIADGQEIVEKPFALDKVGKLAAEIASGVAVSMKANRQIELLSTALLAALGAPQQLSIDQIKKRVAKRFGIAVYELQFIQHAKARNLSIYLCRHLTAADKEEVARAFSLGNLALVDRAIAQVEEQYGLENIYSETLLEAAA